MKRIRWPVLATVAVLVAGSGTAYAVTNDPSTGSYRTVRATKGDVEEVLSTSGSVDAARRADLEFGAAGTVARLAVAVGDTVRAGQVIARLDAHTLQAAVTRARASVARAVAQLEADKDAQAQAVADAASSKPKANKPKSSTPSASPTSSGPDPDTAAQLQALKDQQDAVLQAQTAATTAIAAAKDALTAQTAACADAYQEDGKSGDGDATACSTALAEVQARQDDVSAAQDALAKALSTLAATLTQALATLSANSATPSDDPTTPSGGSTTPASDGAVTPTADQPDSSSGTVTAARLAADQAAIEKARADLVDAQQQLRQAVLRSTRSGRVVSLPVAEGDQVSAGDVGAVVVGGKAVTIKGTVPSAKVGQVKVGETVRVTTPGQPDTAEGTVTAVGLVADTSSGTATYPVTVTVEDPTIPLPAGSQAMLAIVVATAKDVVTVPISAVTRRGDAASVRTWDGKELSRTGVTIGTVGAREVEITHGLEPGDEVVVADIDQAITGAADSLDQRGGFKGIPLGRSAGGGPGGGPVTFKSGP
ncbi:MAG: biotin/lipoyl-binding protein [Propionibacteriales bacterium]|nr:biotin/lipoyl-binding protein [Propionibacteriales bacterium]